MTRQYAKRTCGQCGCIEPQNKMSRKTIQVYSGKSQSATHGGTWLGAFAGNKNSYKKISRDLFANNKRTYHRNKEVWLCSECTYNYEQHEQNKPSTSEFNSELKSTISGFFGLVGSQVFVIVASISFILLVHSCSA